jgi:hypothetical protein
VSCLNRLGACAACGGDVILVNFDALNGARVCTECNRRGPDALLVFEAGCDVVIVADETSDDQTAVEWAPELLADGVTEENTRVNTPAPSLLAAARKENEIR